MKTCKINPEGKVYIAHQAPDLTVVKQTGLNSELGYDFLIMDLPLGKYEMYNVPSLENPFIWEVYSPDDYLYVSYTTTIKKIS